MVTEMQQIAQAIDLAGKHSRFLRALMRRYGDWPSALRADGPDAFLAPVTQPLDGLDAGEIRRLRSRLALGVAVADLAGLYDLTEVTSRLSNFADAAIDWAVRKAIADRVPGAAPDGFAVLALGKLGSRELNYSSDVDLIYLFDGDRLPVREGEDPAEAVNRYARRITELLQQRTSDGYVARVDLQLRPDSEAFGLATPIRRAELYYQSEALTWSGPPSSVRDAWRATFPWAALSSPTSRPSSGAARSTLRR